MLTELAGADDLESGGDGIPAVSLTPQARAG
jgi:hypothetical protein